MKVRSEDGHDIHPEGHGWRTQTQRRKEAVEKRGAGAPKLFSLKTMESRKTFIQFVSLKLQKLLQCEALAVMSSKIK